MLGYFIYLLFGWVVLAATQRPWIGIVGFYGFVLLQPNWNWRWVIDRDFQFQKWIAAATLLGILLNGLRGNALTGKAKLAAGCLIGFLALAYISASQSIAPVYSWWYMDLLWKIVLMAILGMFLLDSREKILTMLWVICLAQGYNAFQINLYYFQEGFCRFARSDWGWASDNNTYSIMTVSCVGVSLGLAVYSEKLWQRALAAGIGVLQVHQVMLMESRGAMLGGLFTCGLIVWFMPKLWRTVVPTLAVAVLGFLLAGPSVIEEFSSTLESGENLDSSAESRFQLWKAGAAITADFPMLGVGPYAGQILVPTYYRGSDRSDRKGLHNLFFEISTGCGVPAVLLYLGFFAIPGLAGAYWLQFRTPWLEPWQGAALLGTTAGVAGYWLSSMFSSGALLESSYILTSVAAATLMVMHREQAAAAYEEEAIQYHLWEQEHRQGSPSPRRRTAVSC